MACTSVSAMECTDYIDEHGTLGKKCVRDADDIAGRAGWTVERPMRSFRMYKQPDGKTIYEDKETGGHITCTPNIDGSEMNCRGGL